MLQIILTPSRVELHLFYNTIVFIPDSDRHVSTRHVPASGRDARHNNSIVVRGIPVPE